MARGIQTYDYTVTGTGQFPFDMLRYDQAWPANEATTIGFDFPRRTGNLTRSVQLQGLREPTNDRWENFGWKVSDFQRSSVLQANATVR